MTRGKTKWKFEKRRKRKLKHLNLEEWRLGWQPTADPTLEKHLVVQSSMYLISIVLISWNWQNAIAWVWILFSDLSKPEASGWSQLMLCVCVYETIRCPFWSICASLCVCAHLCYVCACLWNNTLPILKYPCISVCVCVYETIHCPFWSIRAS